MFEYNILDVRHSHLCTLTIGVAEFVYMLQHYLFRDGFSTPPN